MLQNGNSLASSFYPTVGRQDLAKCTRQKRMFSLILYAVGWGLAQSENIINDIVMQSLMGQNAELRTGLFFFFSEFVLMEFTIPGHSHWKLEKL